MDYQDFTQLDVYKRCRKFRRLISRIVKQYFPPQEKYLLTAQILDASRSVTANLAEGHGRYYYQDNIKFCRISRGSLEESLEHMITAYDEKYIPESELKTVKEERDHCNRLLNGYIRFLDKSKRKEKK